MFNPKKTELTLHMTMPLKNPVSAKQLVIEGFLSALVERFEQGPVREVLAAALERRLALILG